MVCHSASVMKPTLVQPVRAGVSMALCPKILTVISSVSVMIALMIQSVKRCVRVMVVVLMVNVTVDRLVGVVITVINMAVPEHQVLMVMAAVVTALVLTISTKLELVIVQTTGVEMDVRFLFVQTIAQIMEHVILMEKFHSVNVIATG